MKNLRATLVVLALSLVAAGCSETHGEMMDAAITFDAVIPDAPDTGPAPNNVGDSCRDDGDCDGEGTYCDPDFPGGYCRAPCDAAECPDGSTCVDTGRGGAFCFGECELDAPDGDLCPRDGYGCIVDLGVCFPGCDVDEECSGDLVCAAGGGGSGSGRCADPSAVLGDACVEQEECGTDQFCLSERWSGIPGGVCGEFGCDPDSGAGCPANGVCRPMGRAGGVCLLACEVDNDCTRADQGCTPSRNGGYCGPEFIDANLGQICSADRGDCTGGFCATEADTGFPDSYCMATGCDPLAQTGCPGDGVCIDGADGAGICLDGCAADSDCRAGYDCLNADASDPASPTACRPGCDDASVCGNPGFECNSGTGLCTEPFVEATLGEPCADGGDCVGGRCLSEPDTGWPAGTCSFPGCRLSGTGREAICPTDATCVDDDGGDPELGVCVDDCADTSDCRPGYACIDGACVPSCGTGDCAGGRTCNMTTGLCG